VTISGNHTWSHCNGDPGTTNGSPAASSNEHAYLFPDNRKLDGTNCPGDRRHIFNMTAVAETPQFDNPTVRALATGWRLAGIYKRSTGEFLTVSTGLDRALSGQYPTIQRPNQLLLNIYGDKSLKNWFNPAAFAQPPLGTYGNAGRGRYLGPGTWQFDMALSRIFRIRESQRLEFRAEAFNVTNSLRKGNPEVDLNANTFGQINSAFDARIMQFALKYVF
jgi:hypothetical protein